MMKCFNPGFNVIPHGSHYFGVDLLITTCLSGRKYTLIQKALTRMTAKLTGVVHVINNLTTSVRSLVSSSAMGLRLKFDELSILGKQLTNLVLS